MENKIAEIFSQGLGFWEFVGFLGLAVFSSRFIIQWIASERKKKSVIPVAFWYLSIIGSLCLLAYAIKRADPVFILSYLFNGFIYMRNLALIRKTRKLEALIGG
jgi:lipid-A-disaccharide synthase-like uncharacterized protein